MNPVVRLLSEYRTAARILHPKDFAYFFFASVGRAPSVIRTRSLSGVDAEMSRDLVVSYRNQSIALPIKKIDQLLASYEQSKAFGLVRELYANDCYVRHFTLPGPLNVVLDLGANRGMFTLLALAALGARRAIGVEPQPVYDETMRLLLDANHIEPGRAVRYHKFAGSRNAEQRDPKRNISIESILAEQSINRVGFLKIDIEGSEKDLFSEPEWLCRVDNIAIELHARMVGDLSLIPKALEAHGFRFRATTITGEPCAVNDALYLHASSTGCLKD